MGRGIQRRHERHHPLPAEHLGLARDFRRRIQSANAIVILVVQQTSFTLLDRLQRHPVPRPDTLVQVTRCCRPVGACVWQSRSTHRAQKEDADDRGDADRMVAVSSRGMRTDRRELGLGIIQISLSIASHSKFGLSNVKVAGVSRYALARHDAVATRPTMRSSATSICSPTRTRRTPSQADRNSSSRCQKADSTASWSTSAQSKARRSAA
jgi:hypothetical protein